MSPVSEKGNETATKAAAPQKAAEPKAAPVAAPAEVPAPVVPAATAPAEPQVDSEEFKSREEVRQRELEALFAFKTKRSARLVLIEDFVHDSGLLLNLVCYMPMNDADLSIILGMANAISDLIPLSSRSSDRPWCNKDDLVEARHLFTNFSIAVCDKNLASTKESAKSLESLLRKILSDEYQTALSRKVAIKTSATVLGTLGAVAGIVFGARAAANYAAKKVASRMDAAGVPSVIVVPPTDSAAAEVSE